MDRHYFRYITIRRKAELAQVLNLTERQVILNSKNKYIKDCFLFRFFRMDLCRVLIEFAQFLSF